MISSERSCRNILRIKCDVFTKYLLCVVVRLRGEKIFCEANGLHSPYDATAAASSSSKQQQQHDRLKEELPGVRRVHAVLL